MITVGLRQIRLVIATTSCGRPATRWCALRNGSVKEEKQATTGPVDTTLAKKIDANTWDFDLKKDGKVIGHVHRVVSADGKTLTVHNTGVLRGGAMGDETLVFAKQ